MKWWWLVLLSLGCDDGAGGVANGDGGPTCGPELCNGADDDCDGRMDEDFDLRGDPAHCGDCATRCDYRNGVAGCDDGACHLDRCAPGFADADRDPENGCEGACTGNDRERCNGRDDDCDGAADEGFDLAINLDHCGGCDQACVRPNADTRCMDRRCVVARCQPGFGDDDGDPDNGCEAPCAPVSPGPEICDGEDNDCDGRTDEGFDRTTDGEHCGQCGNRCAYANGSGRCLDGICRLTTCEPGFVDADGRPDNGCEARCTPSGGGVELCDEVDNDCDGGVDEAVDKDTDVQNCGGCGRLDEAFVCRLPNAVVACLEGACVVDACEPGFVDADGRPANGCETPCRPSADGIEICDGADNDCDGRTDEGFDLETSLAHCGACDAPCAAGNAEPACVAGRCAIAACPPGFVDADLDPGTGCEYACVPDGEERCDAADNDCDGRADEGFDVFADPAHCGGCDVPCALPNAVPVCRLGTCDLAGCVEGWFDANGQPDDGCEVACQPSDDGLERCNGVDDDCDEAVDEGFDLDTDALHCGACDRRCAAPNAVISCRAGACEPGDCLAGWYDLNNDRDDGCEYRCDGEPGADEVCDGDDDDCNGIVDDGFDLRHDPRHCGGCRIDCAAPNATTECQDGRCAITECTPGFVDVNDRPGDGCEAPCVLAPDGREACNRVDDDCDGRTDEDYDLLGDLAHCGGCDAACAVPNGAPFCNAGRCAVLRCDGGFADADGDAANGCECRISNGGVEACDAIDNDCNGVIDDADQLAPPADIQCLPFGVCQGVRPACRGAEWRCVYPPEFDADADPCDGQDNDCDGRSDEGFPELGRPCVAGVGACGEAGEIACAGPAATGCTARADPERATSETCNAVDDDCDGMVDEAADVLVDVPGPAPFSIYAFEASRTDGSAEQPGRSFLRACSAPGRLPWVDVDRDTAARACAAAGLRLCSAAQWARACGGDQAAPYPYGPVYDADACNGLDHDPDEATPGNQDHAVPGGSRVACRRDWPDPIYDLSGNVWEWIADGGPETGLLRGGSFGNIAPGLTCQFELASPPASHRQNVGFRCCTP